MYTTPIQTERHFCTSDVAHTVGVADLARGASVVPATEARMTAPFHHMRICSSGSCRLGASLATTLDKKKNHHRDSRREERCSTCDIMLDQARSAQGKSRGQSRIGLALR